MRGPQALAWELRMTWRGCALHWWLAVCAVIGPALSGRAQAPPEADEYTIKAAQMRHFPTYIAWPTDFVRRGQDEFGIGILGKDPFGKGVRDRLSQLTVGDTKTGVKKVVVRHFETLDNWEACHLVFLAPEPATKESHLTPDQRLARLLKRLDGAPVLIVTDTQGLARRGAMINFYLENDRVQFEINPKAAKRAGLGISSNLLKGRRIITTEAD